MLLGFLTMILAMGFIRQNLLDWGWMKEQSVVEKTEHIRDVRLEQPLTIKCDGHNLIASFLVRRSRVREAAKLKETTSVTGVCCREWMVNANLGPQAGRLSWL